MAETTGIEWCDHTANWWWGCVKVSPLCDHCYAERDSARYGHSVFGLDAPRRFIMSVGMSVDKWQRQAKATGQRKRVFVMSMGDFFEQLPDGHPDRNHMEAVRIEACALMEVSVDLEFLVLTKRISNVAKMVPVRWLKGEWPCNIRLGVSVGTQKDADRDIPRLMGLGVPNFLSMEPLLSPVDISPHLVSGWSCDHHPGPCECKELRFNRRIEWVITGGESGPNARPSHPDWFRALRDQCAAAGVPFLFKQWGRWIPEYDAGAQANTVFPTAKIGERFYRFPDGTPVMAVGKKAAGRLLDGVLHDGYPEVKP